MCLNPQVELLRANILVIDSVTCQPRKFEAQMPPVRRYRILEQPHPSLDKNGSAKYGVRRIQISHAIAVPAFRLMRSHDWHVDDDRLSARR